ncbi:MAG: 4-(cytidine 5'-diphospho)-2-C-methyl-D-erythritol kinase [Acidimicrobiia bacterium]|nr:4-(cytidine 5'-diphospho)-2-C-methyl-D-erythritol kinase [Acidimicrobiia bacterium]MYC57871.1 4-(cytidine 5'-diphospho)-2-C-methyl-D-erythritol kinase [Acidimicrobiia bacterium]MYG93422.1 4-(cytidine 5'-diphospho)-2-C-methyl-D-erythritol kinase [Acidimicrobiia bacterium]MYI31178.1 4-(cytidine 5'-diphospho)-2-C-methyl-D-erythritol kinase [Acidimicrobiia bacterium]
MIVAPAKLTLSLCITGVRSDGYHLLDAEMVTLDLADKITIEPIQATGSQSPDSEPISEIVIQKVSTIGVSTIGNEVIDPIDNLITHALRLVKCAAKVVVTKNIPPKAGLGGGSADAAAILRWAGYSDGYSDLEAAASLGADVPFCLVGGRARVTGIGEQIQPLEHIVQQFTLLIPPFGCSTSEVYRRWDEMGQPQGVNGNDLEPAALDVAPALALYRDKLECATGQKARLAGSGSTWFVEGAYPGADRIVVNTISPSEVG